MRSLTKFIAPVFIIALVSGCGTSNNSAIHKNTVHPTSMPTPTPTPKPDNEQLQTVGVGLSSYLITTVPIVVVKNLASHTSARSLQANFQILNSRNAQVQSSEDQITVLAPGQTGVLAGRLDLGSSGNHATGTVTVGRWSETMAPTINATQTSYKCGTCGPRSGSGDVATVLVSNIASPAPLIHAAAACFGSTGDIVGGGTQDIAWPTGSKTFMADVPVIVNVPPASCIVSATVAG